MGDEWAIEEAAKHAKLEPCPFCGGAAEWSKGQQGDGSDWWYISCSDCEAMGPAVGRDVITYRDACVRAWNTRTTPTETR